MDGHDGPHLVNDPLLLDCKPTVTFLDHGIVHKVEWFEFTHTSRKRELWTVCGRIFSTHNRTKPYKLVTCVECAAR